MEFNRDLPKITSGMKICIVGLGYVGLPLLNEFAKCFKVVGYDIAPRRIEELKQGIDITGEVDCVKLSNSADVLFTSSQEDISGCDVYIVTVPTPVDENHTPDMTHLTNASEIIGSVISRGTIVIYESTVFPGATEEICVPILERTSGLCAKTEFSVGYSPERINPGDKVNRLSEISKIVAGTDIATTKFMADLYGAIINAEIFSASSIKVAEAAKVLENTQRDINIALMNEFSLICNRLGVDTTAVIEAASTKWNFVPFRPGLVGGHCIGVDPYYLTHKAQLEGYYPDLILTSRRLNNRIAHEICLHTVRLLAQKHMMGKILVVGCSFKENCPDTRNSKVFDIINELRKFNFEVHLYDPVVFKDQAKENGGAIVVPNMYQEEYACVILAVPHEEIVNKNLGFFQSLKDKGVIFIDLKAYFSENYSHYRL